MLLKCIINPSLMNLAVRNGGSMVSPGIPNVRENRSDLLVVKFVPELRHRSLTIQYRLNDWFGVVQGHNRVAGQPGIESRPAHPIHLMTFCTKFCIDLLALTDQLLGMRRTLRVRIAGGEDHSDEGGH
jgi:hypothetical protein